MNVAVSSENDSRILYLKSKDKRLSVLIDKIGDLSITMHEDEYVFMVREIIGQMLSNKVADVITTRLEVLCDGRISTQAISSLGFDQLQSIGLSKAKTQYIFNFNEAITKNVISFERFRNMTDEEVMKALMSISGIGAWTSKMYLLFVLKRENVLPYEDGAFIQSYKWLYNTRKVRPENIKMKCKKWEPYSSLASRYMYIALDSGITQKPFAELEAKLVE